MENATNRFITNEQLLKLYLTPSTEQYFYKKLSSESPKYIKIKVCELLKFLILSPHSQGPILFNEELDVLWHYWTLQAKQYQQLMEILPAKQYIHHSCNDHIDNNKTTSMPNDEIDRQVSFLVSYICKFGNFEDNTVRFWPMAINVMNLNGFTVDELNRYLINLAACYASSF